MKTMAAVYEIPICIGIPIIILAFFMPTDQLQFIVGAVGILLVAFGYGFGAIFALTIMTIRTILWARMLYLDWRYGDAELLPAPPVPLSQRFLDNIDRRPRLT